MGLLKPVRWLGKLFQRSTSPRAGPPTSSTIQAPRIAAFPPSSHKALRRLVSHASLLECRQGIAKTTAFSVQHHAASETPHARNTSIDLHQFTHSNAAGREPFGEDIATRNLRAKNRNDGKLGCQDIWREGDPFQAYATYNPHQLRKKVVAKALDEERRPIFRPAEGRKQPRDADALPWTPRNRRKSACDDRSDRYSLNESEVDLPDLGPEIVHASIILPPSRPRSLSHKRSIHDLRSANKLGHKRSQTFPGADPPRMCLHAPITQADLDKPLPPLPCDTSATTVQTKWEPAVTHQTIQRDVHEIHQDHVTNEYHQDEYQHRVLPILDQEILPARHFIQLDGGALEEISQEDVPWDLPLDLQQRISDAAATIFSERFRDSGISFGSMDGSAHPGNHSHPSFSFVSMDGTLEPTQTTQRDSLTPQGHARRDTTWTYPPAFLPVQHGAEQHDQVLFHVGGEGKAHVRSFSDGPPRIPVRGVRTSGCAPEEVAWQGNAGSASCL